MVSREGRRAAAVVVAATAIALCREHAKPILVFNFKKDGNIIKAIKGDTVGTWIGKKD